MKSLEQPCKECGAEVTLEWCDPYPALLTEYNICFNCNFWREYVERKDDPEICRVNGSHYVIAPPTSNKFGVGYGASKFKIKKGDKIIETKNLWHQGTIPKHFAARLPDNAEFVRG